MLNICCFHHLECKSLLLLMHVGKQNCLGYQLLVEHRNQKDVTLDLNFIFSVIMYWSYYTPSALTLISTTIQSSKLKLVPIS